MEMIQWNKYNESNFLFSFIHKIIIKSFSFISKKMYCTFTGQNPTWKVFISKKKNLKKNLKKKKKEKKNTVKEFFLLYAISNKVIYQYTSAYQTCCFFFSMGGGGCLASSNRWVWIYMYMGCPDPSGDQACSPHPLSSADKLQIAGTQLLLKYEIKF